MIYIGNSMILIFFILRWKNWSTLFMLDEFISNNNCLHAYQSVKITLESGLMFGDPIRLFKAFPSYFHVLEDKNSGMMTTMEKDDNDYFLTYSWHLAYVIRNSATPFGLLLSLTVHLKATYTKSIHPVGNEANYVVLNEVIRMSRCLHNVLLLVNIKNN